MVVGVSYRIITGCCFLAVLGGLQHVWSVEYLHPELSDC
jgi:hypothetical protein